MRVGCKSSSRHRVLLFQNTVFPLFDDINIITMKNRAEYVAILKTTRCSHIIVVKFSDRAKSRNRDFDRFELGIEYLSKILRRKWHLPL